MQLVVRHVLLPGLATGAIFALYLTPVSVIGCVNRGLMALAVVFVALVVGIAAAVIALRLRSVDRQRSAWWALSALILAVPALLLFGPLG